MRALGSGWLFKAGAARKFYWTTGPGLDHWSCPPRKQFYLSRKSQLIYELTQEKKTEDTVDKKPKQKLKFRLTQSQRNTETQGRHTVSHRHISPPHEDVRIYQNPAASCPWKRETFIIKDFSLPPCLNTFTDELGIAKQVSYHLPTQAHDCFNTFIWDFILAFTFTSLE